MYRVVLRILRKCNALVHALKINVRNFDANLIADIDLVAVIKWIKTAFVFDFVLLNKIYFFYLWKLILRVFPIQTYDARLFVNSDNCVAFGNFN